MIKNFALFYKSLSRVLTIPDCYLTGIETDVGCHFTVVFSILFKR